MFHEKSTYMHIYCVLTFECQLHKMVKHTQTICRLLSTNCLNVFDHFLWLALKWLKTVVSDFYGTHSEAYSEPSQITKMKRFAKVVKGFQPLIIYREISILVRCLKGISMHLFPILIQQKL